MEGTKIEIAEKVPASRKLGADTAHELIEGARIIHIAKGKKLDTFGGGEVRDEIVKKMLGATGNLRAPTIKAGDVVVVGFNEDLYSEIFSS